MTNTESTTIWDKIDLSVREESSRPPDSAKPDAASRRRRRRRLLFFLDSLGAVFWLYVLLKLFVFDVDRYVVERVAPRAVGLLDFRFFGTLGVLLIVAVVVKRRRNALYVLYVAFFPFVVVGWKLPKILIRVKSWILVVAIVHAGANVLHRFRRNFIAGSLAIFATLDIVIAGSAVFLVPATVLLSVFLGRAYFRTIVSSFKPSSFLAVQEQMISAAVGSRQLDQFIVVDAELKRPEVETFTKEQLDKFLGAVGGGILANRAIYYWAYQLERYRTSPARFLLGMFSYFWLYVQTVIIFALINYAVFKMDADGFSFDSPPTFLVFVYYSLSALFVNGIASLDPVNTIPLLLRIAEGIVGPLLLLTLVANLLLTARNSRDDQALRQVIAGFKEQAAKHEEYLAREYEMPIDQALRRLQELGLGIVGMISFITTKIPNEFWANRAPPDGTD
jgi:hypothetical protein